MRNYKCDATAIGQRLKDARLSSKKGMTQLGFAEEIGVCVSNISKTEQGLLLPKLPPEARQYLHGIFMDMIDKYPRH